MRRRFLLLAILAVTLAALMGPAWAGHPHFVSLSVSKTGENTITATGKEAGLGNEEQVHIVLSATAECINGGGKHPRAANKTSVSSEDDFPVQNGRAEFTLSVTATFQPNCSPPMTVRFTDVRVTDTTNGLSKNFSGQF